MDIVVVVVKLSTTLLKMFNPVETSILNFRRKMFLHSIAVHVGYKHARSIQPTNVLLKRYRHKLDTSVC